MKQIRLTTTGPKEGRGRRGSFFSSATLPGSVGAGGGFDGLCSSRHSWIHFFCKRKHNNEVTFIVLLNLVHLDSRMNGSHFVIY